jgi:flagellar protein FliS
MPTSLPENSYLRSKVCTASQPQLQLMLLEGAVRFGRQARQACEESVPEAERLLDRTLDVVETLVHGVTGGKTEISERLEGQYAFLFRELAACRIHQDVEKLDGVLSLLEYERETWKQACDRCEADVPGEGVPPVESPVAGQSESVAVSPVPAPSGAGELPANYVSFSLEA